MKGKRLAITIRQGIFRASSFQPRLERVLLKSPVLDVGLGTATTAPRSTHSGTVVDKKPVINLTTARVK